MLPSTWFLLCALVALTALIAAATVQVPDWVPASSLVLVLVIGGFLLRPRELVVLYVTVVLALVYANHETAPTGVNKGVVVVLAAVAVVMWFVVVSRSRLGLQGTIGATMLVDLRDRLRAQGELPQLPVGWRAETVLRSAYGDKFSGDFLVASRSTDGCRLEVALVDVSGKGQGAGTRALLLSGAFGGLLGAMPAAEFLDSANQYLLRQRWDEGFATAVHLEVDLGTGDFRLCSAGHPPAAHFVNGAGRWDLLDGGSGPILGVVHDAVFGGTSGRLARGDALMLYTDGVVETPGRDLDVGIDRMLGQAQHLVQHGFTGGARRLVEGALAGETDDRAVVLIWRE
ncbi:MAG TPA: PP2C family protein-serine/threonine phosphatase [Actinomycetales bacterium]|nr:PP2C family protein-serine/threonine phosphatase [Actinomycetales bacterium]